MEEYYVNDQLLYLVSMTGMSHQDFARAIGISRATMSNINSKRYKPSVNVLQMIAKAFPMVNMNWLISGQGSILNDPKMSVSDIMITLRTRAKELDN